MVMGRKRMSLERKVKQIAFAREGGRRVGRIGFEGSKGLLMSDRDLKEKKRTRDGRFAGVLKGGKAR